MLSGDAYGTWPESYEVREDAAQHRLCLSTPYYEIEHDLQQGGTIREIRYPCGTNQNVLLQAMDATVTLSDERLFADAAEQSPQIEITNNGSEVVLIFKGRLRDSGGNDSDVSYQYRYAYRWGYVRVRKEFHFPQKGIAVRSIKVHGLRLRPDLGHYGVRPGIGAEQSPNPEAFGVCQWGKLEPGKAFDCAYQTRFVPRYFVIGSPGREGLEWFVTSDLAQWDYQLTGIPGHGHFWIGPQTQPEAVKIDINALELPHGDVTLHGTCTFDFYIGFPILSGKAHKPFLHRTFNRKNWPTEQTIRSWAERGVRTAHFHHDGDTFRDGLFWRDGMYPPFGQGDMAEFDRVIDACHRYGIRVATYFSNKELHPTNQAYKEHGKEWARLPTDRGEQIHNFYSGDEFGAQMCLKSGWLDYLKQYIDTVLTRHRLDGVYYDWNVALYCHNQRHGNADSSGESPRLGAMAQSPAGHWDMDELLDLMEWTRKRVGQNGLVIIHNTMSPCAATENFADYVVAMEWGYGKLAVAAPSLSELPLEWNFLGSRSRGVIGSGCLVPNAPQSLHRQMTLRCLLTGTAPWPAQDLDLEMFAPLAGEDISTYRFADWRTKAVSLNNPDVFPAVYHRPDQAILLLGNLTHSPQIVCCKIDITKLSLSYASQYRVILGDGTAKETSYDDFITNGITLTIAGDSLSMVRLFVTRLV